MSARIAIAGGGPTGLMMGRLLAGDGHEVTIFEAAHEIGGLCRSRTVDGFVFDLAGGHIMFTKDARVQAFWDELFPDEPLVVSERHTRILHDRGCWVSYPFENALGELPLEHNLECTEGVVRAHLRRERGEPAPHDFENWVRWKMGDGVAQHFMHPYNRKLWKCDLTQMGTVWIAGRVPDAPLADVLTASLGHTTEGYTHQSVFRYPRTGGFAAIHERIARPIADRVVLGHRVQRIERVGDEWDVDGQRFDHVVSTIPLHSLPRVLADMESGPRQAASKLRWRGLVSYLLGIDAEHVQPFSWVYLPHAWQGPANRITYISNYSPENAPTGKGSIMAEVTYDGTPADASKAGRLEVARGLERAGLLDAERLVVTDAHDNPHAYIFYDLEFESKRDTVLGYLDGLPGFHAIGRFGRYDYHNSDQCLASAFDLHARMRGALARGGGPIDGAPSRG
ncbi:MAG: FAD-dependent oxidoreductase [Planctomycetes bacterium]|nr:FAD-dependent oxidoreductase [Planctomycetota bacterium]